MTVAKLLKPGLHRVLDGTVGMTFIVDSFTDGVAGKVAHVRDYRYASHHRPFQVWSIAADGYEVINDT